jgi:hypothetical protein
MDAQDAFLIEIAHRIIPDLRAELTGNIIRIRSFVCE